MLKKATFVLLTVAGLALAAAPHPYANLALNPVKFTEPPNHPVLPLIKDGKLNFVIVRDMQVETGKMDSRRKSISLSVDALQDALQRTTGQQAQVVDAASAEAASAAYVIALGKSTLTDKLGLKPLDMPKEAFLVKSFGKGIVIAGHDGSLIPDSYHKMDWTRYRLNGTLNGTYDFIERVLGVRYYYPGMGIVAPKITDLTVMPLSYTDEPYFRNRYNWGYAYRQPKEMFPDDMKVENDFDLAWRMAMSTRRTDACHSPDPHYLLAAFPDKKDVIFFTDRTGYQYYNPSTHIGNLMDITNPELAKLLVASFKKYYETDGEWRLPWSHKGRTWYPPNSEYALFSQADTFVRDLQKPENAHLFPEERKNSGSGKLSDLYVNFYCWMGNEMKKELPGKRLHVLAYHNYTLPPLVCTDIPDNIDFQVCMGRIIMAKTTASQKNWRNTFEGWYKVLGNRPVTAWTYGAQGSAYTQAIQGRYMKDYINCIKPWLSREGLFYDASGLQWKFYYSYYPAYRSFWNPNFNVDAALDEHWEKLYGSKAGAALKAFYGLLVERWEDVAVASFNSTDSRANSNVTPEVLYKAYNIQTVEKLEALLAEAIAATEPGSIERKRVEFFAAPWSKDFTASKAYCTMVIPTYEVKRVGRQDSIAVDGKLDEAFWGKVKPIPMQQAKGEGGELPSKPEAKLAWDEKGLYLAFTCQGAPRINKGDVWFDSDNIEFFVSPGTEKATYYQFAVSPGNDFSDAYKVEKPMEAALDSHWSCEGLQRAVSYDDNSWTLEMFIPFEGLHRTEPPKPYTSWFGNIINNKLMAAKKNAEYSSFSITMGNNHNHSLWGKFKFMDRED